METFTLSRRGSNLEKFYWSGNGFFAENITDAELIEVFGDDEAKALLIAELIDADEPNEDIWYETGNIFSDGLNAYVLEPVSELDDDDWLFDEEE